MYSKLHEAHSEVLHTLLGHGVRMRLQRQGRAPDVGGVHCLLMQHSVAKDSVREGRRWRLHWYIVVPARLKRSGCDIPAS